jgi:hypothetical protein
MILDVEGGVCEKLGREIWDWLGRITSFRDGEGWDHPTLQQHHSTANVVLHEEGREDQTTKGQTLVDRLPLQPNGMSKRQWYGSHLYTEAERTYYVGFTYDNQLFQIGSPSTSRRNTFGIECFWFKLLKKLKKMVIKE